MIKIGSWSKKMRPQGIVLYKGPSKLDGKNIIVIATGLKDKTDNPKLGDMIPIWIMRRDIPPTLAARIGEDYSICGDCKHRDLNSCYVNLHHGPLNVYNAFHRDRYLDLSDNTPQAIEYLKGKSLRFGAYGDPACISTNLWSELAAIANTQTSYTHAWKTCDPGLKRYCMASCDTAKEKIEAQALGWRTFRIRLENEELFNDEIMCPASNEAGKLTTCSKCGLCKGNCFLKSVAIMPHGGGVNAWRVKNFKIGIKKIKNKKKWKKDFKEIKARLYA